MENHEYYMSEALKEAMLAYEKKEVPVGCVIVHNNTIISRGHNQRNIGKNALAHAEIIAIRDACEVLGDWRLENSILYVTTEPCAMCAGAIIQARIKSVVFGTRNKKAGCGGSILNILNNPSFNHQTEVIEGVLESLCSRLMSDFFSDLRSRFLKE